MDFRLEFWFPLGLLQVHFWTPLGVHRACLAVPSGGIRVSLGRLFGLPGVPFGVVWGSLGGPWAVVWPLGCLGGARRENPGNFRAYFGSIFEVFVVIFRSKVRLCFLMDLLIDLLMISD